jgi:hypothetical protein
MMIRIEIEQICARNGTKVATARSTEELRSILEHDESSNKSLVICDLVSSQRKLDTLASFRKNFGFAILGFYPHVNKKIEALAHTVGVDYIVPRSALYARISGLLKPK